MGCLLIHGFGGSPPEMRPMGEFLAQKGLTVLGVRLAGHGTTPEDMARTGWRDWVASAEEGLEELQGRCDPVFLAGLSMGGLISPCTWRPAIPWPGSSPCPRRPTSPTGAFASCRWCNPSCAGSLPTQNQT